jgi:hypothetical protein
MAFADSPSLPLALSPASPSLPLSLSLRSQAALYYYAFLTADPESSILRVASGVFIYITVAHWWNICMTIWFPLLWHRWKLYSMRLKLRDAVNEAEKRQKSGEQQMDINQAVLLEQAQSSVWEETMLPEFDTFDDFV